MRRVALLLLAAVVACTKTPPPQPRQATKRTARVHRLDEKEVDDAAERASVTNFTRGATVIARTGELFLEAAAVRAIDTDPLSYWMPPPHDLPQSMTIALAARTRIDRIGIRTDEELPANHVQFERSTNGVDFVPLGTIASRDIHDPQWLDVTPAEATHVRVTMLDHVRDGRDPRLRSILVRGTEVEQPRAAAIDGCWSINETRGRFRRRGASITGTIDMGSLPMHLDGGFNGRSNVFNWVRGNDYGYALITVSPDARHASGIEWHEEAIPLFFGESWFGEPQPCKSALANDTREKFLARTGRLSLFGIRFRDDGTIDRDASAELLSWIVNFARTHPVQFAAHEFRQRDANANRQFAQRELDSLRDELQRAGVANTTFVARGSDAPRQKPLNDSMRVIYSTVDLEIRR